MYDINGEFLGFFGANRVEATSEIIANAFWNTISTESQRARSTKTTPVGFSNFDIDDEGFIYTVTESSDVKTDTVKKLNPKGQNILSAITADDVTFGDISPAYYSIYTKESALTDIDIGPNGEMNILDFAHGRIFQYDKLANLMFVMGGTGEQLGTFRSATAIESHDNMLYVLDSRKNSITVFKRTAFGEIVTKATNLYNDGYYEESYEPWLTVIKYDGNYRRAYIGIGNGYRNQSEYKEAMRYYKYAYDVTNYSAAFKNLRQDWITRFPWVVPIVIVAIVLAYYFFFRYVGKVNVKGHTKTTKRTFWEEILYGFHLIFHPFDGFWDLKHEKRGSIRGAVFYIFITIIAFTYKSVGSSYMMNPSGNYMSIFSVIVSVAAPLLLWCVSNWCLTTLFDGEGSFKDIFIATSYALVPLALILIPTTIASYIVIESEIQVINFLCGIAYAWTGFLVFFGSMVTHDYSFGKNVLICIFTLVGVVFIVFLALLFVSLINQIISFVLNIVLELTYRV